MGSMHEVGTDCEEYTLDFYEIACEGVKKMLAEAVDAEVRDYIKAATEEWDEQVHALMVRSGYARKREILLGTGPQ